jgi:hypothetical protein
MAKRVCLVLGVVFLVVGLAGWVMPRLLGAHLMPVHNVIHLVSGAAALYFGLRGTEPAARAFSRGFGIFYLLLGVVGFLAGDGPERMLSLIPGQLELGTVDHVIHVVLGAAFLVGGFADGTRR